MPEFTAPAPSPEPATPAPDPAACYAPFPTSPPLRPDKGEVTATLPRLQGTSAPAGSAARPTPGNGEVLATLPKLQGMSGRPGTAWSPVAKPVDPMARAYRLTTLSTLVTYAVLSQVASTAVAVVLYGMLFLGSHRSIGDILSNLTEGGSASFLLTVYALGYVGGLLLGMKISKTIRRRLPTQRPEERPLSAAAFLRCALAAFGLWGVGVLIGNFPAYIVPIETTSFGWNSVPLWLLAIVVAPIFEELVFRKLVLDRIGSFGEAPAVLCSALIFGLAHQNAGQFFLAFLLGILFARIYLHTGKIVYTMLLHFMINFTATFDEVGCLIWGDGFELWFLLALGVLALAGIVLLVIYRKDPILGLPCRLSYEERQKSMRCWPVTMVKWICVATILLYGLLYALLGLMGGSFTLDDRVRLDPLGLLYLIPAVSAVVFILILARRPARNSVSAPAPAYAPVTAPAPASVYAPSYSPAYAPASAPVSEPISAPVPAPVPEPAPEPVSEPAPEPVSAPVSAPEASANDAPAGTIPY